MKDTGTKMTTRLNVVAMTAQPDLGGGLPAPPRTAQPLLLDEAEDVLEHHDRVVDHDADHQHEREHRHAVEREVERRTSCRTSR